MGDNKDERERDEIAQKMRDLIETAEKEERGITDEEAETLATLTKDLGANQARREATAKARAQLAALGGPDVPPTFDGKARPATLGEHFVNTLGTKGLLRLGTERGLSLSAGEFKAPTDTHVLDLIPGVLRTDIDRTPVREFLRRPFVSDWLLSGTLSGSAITYFVEKAGGFEGAVGVVAEGTRKPQLHHLGWDPVTETLKKVAGFIKVSSEMLEDAAFLVSEIEARLLAELALAEEELLLSGDGAGLNPLGLLNRPGVQTETAADTADLIEAIFRAGQSVNLATGLAADGVVMNPTDFQTVRLQKDANGQYLAGGPFIGAYGNSGVIEPTRIWGMPIIVTPAIEAGTVLVGASQAATVYSKGSFVLSGTNTNEDDFVSNRVTILAEKRIALAVRRPLAFVKITVTAGP